MQRTMVLASAIGSLTMLGTSHADIRVVHASPDAPPVDVYVDGVPGVDAPVIEDLPFTQATDYVPLPSGMYTFRVTPANANNPVVIDAQAMIDEAVDYSVLAVDFLDSIDPLILVDDNSLDPTAARIRFVHASPDAPTVDIFVAGGSDPLFDAVSFTESGGYVSVPGGTYDLEVRLDDGGALALAVPGVSVENGTVVTIFAMGSVDAGTIQAVPVVDAAQGPGGAEVRVVHASPDAPNVDVFVNGTPGTDDPVVSDLPFTAATGYLPLAPDVYNFKVTPNDMPMPVVIDADAAVIGGRDYSVVAIGFLEDIKPLILEDENATTLGGARIRFVHASPDAPTVDIFAAGGTEPLFDAVSFGESGGYIQVPAGTYDLEVRLDDGGGLALSVPRVSVDFGTVYTIFAMGSVAGETLQAVTTVDNIVEPDVNGDGAVDIDDLIQIIVNWGPCPLGLEPCTSDADDDGDVDMDDLMSVILFFGA